MGTWRGVRVSVSLLLVVFYPSLGISAPSGHPFSDSKKLRRIQLMDEAQRQLEEQSTQAVAAADGEEWPSEADGGLGGGPEELQQFGGARTSMEEEVNMGITKETCSPTLFQVVAEKRTRDVQFSWQSLTAHDVLKHVLVTLPMTQFGKVPQTPFSNAEGRVNHPVIGTMGGDAGEFILALNAFEKIMDQPLSDFQVATLLSDYLVSVDKPVFFMQTDQMALLNICRKLKFCLPKDRLDNPEPNVISTLREELLQPDSIGCSHIRHLITIPEFQTRADLTRAFIKGYFNLLWGMPANMLERLALQHVRSRLRLQVLQGPHTEGAVLKVKSSECSPDFVPMLTPEHGAVSISISHVTATQTLRQTMARFLKEQAQKMGSAQEKKVTEGRLMKKMNEIADAQYRTALAMDGGKTPVYTLNYPGACCMGGAPRP